MVGKNSLRVLYGYSYFPSQAYSDVQEMDLAYINRLRENGFDVEGFCLTINPPANRLSFRDLDLRWKYGEKGLLRLYTQLEERLTNFDVLINASGINLHPYFISKLPVITVFQCFDDPESSQDLSRPVAAAYDLCLVGNIAELETYKRWGVKNLRWTPMGLMPGFFDATLTEDQIRTEKRDIDLFMMCDRLSPWRKARLEKLGAAFPDAYFFGRGWPRGYLPTVEQLSVMRRARIGPNLHNSTGPINARTYYLPANGILQICDNRSHLGRIFELGKEVIGFDTVDECIDLCRYYMSHEQERLEISINGWKRVIGDYNETEVFRRNLQWIENYYDIMKPKITNSLITLTQKKRKRGIHFFYIPVKMVSTFFYKVNNKVQKTFKRIQNLIKFS